MSTFFRLHIMPYYAVRSGRIPGIYKTWDECKAQVNGFPKARYKKFNTDAEATDFVKDTNGDSRNISSASGYTQQQNKYKNKTSAASSNRLPMKKVSLSNKSEGFDNTDFEGDMKNAYKIEYTKTVYMQPPRSQGAHSRPRGAHSRSRGAHSQGAQSRSKSTLSRSHNASNRNENGDGVVVYTDGGCTNNGQAGAQAGIGVYWGPDDPRNVSERLPGRQTNNRAEIHAACRAIEQAKAQGMPSITIKTDSQFLINAATKWMSGWQRNDWKLSSGGPVKNKEDFLHLKHVSDGINIEWIHVRGHVGILGNEAADSLANEGACKPLP
ncbi:ribonuclease H1-like isoform X2 [Mizuhopecten yessoensis]|uniref:Ribonuclease H1 n=1 Tax=Mizuhopecten yessoensis TaxID=6573 RepID=A0A210QAM4_MIZYE|nr:ribonuclease H1-like isoform X2 [Mizuhopecten yessoensis]OWF45755.1 Ribonuclease H1 [Mizuhopecten yessoensis]